VVRNTHIKRVLLNKSLSRIGHFFETLRLTFPNTFSVYSIQRAAVRELGVENIRMIHKRWEPQLPAHQRRKWMTPRDMRRGVKLALLLGLNRTPNITILDIGCGTGYFLHICRRFGHTVLGLDRTDRNMFREWTSFLEIPGVGFRIRAGECLPAMGRNFDLITIDSPSFNKQWSKKEWAFLLSDLRSHLVADGRLYVMLKFSETWDGLSNGEIRKIFSGVPGFSTEFLTNRQMVLTRIEPEVMHQWKEMRQMAM